MQTKGQRAPARLGGTSGPKRTSVGPPGPCHTRCRSTWTQHFETASDKSPAVAINIIRKVNTFPSVALKSYRPGSQQD